MDAPPREGASGTSPEPPMAPEAKAATATPTSPTPSSGPLPKGLTGAPRAGPRAWLPSLQSLRGLAALAVVLYHIDVDFRDHELPLLGVPGVRFGWMGVDLFFVLSAYLLGRPFLTGRATPFPRFYADRFLRIAPAYYVAWVLIAVYALLWLPGVWQVLTSLWSLVFLNNLHRSAIFALNPVFWTLAVEMQFYLLLPWLARRFAGPHWMGWLAGCIAFALAFRAATWTWMGGFGEDLGTFAMPSFLGHFALGLAACRIRRIPRPSLAALAAVPLLVLPPLLLVPADSLAFGYESFLGQVLLRPVVAVGFALLVLAGSNPGWFERALSWRPFRWLGDVSYSLYLVHVIAILAVDRLLGVDDRWLFVSTSLLASLAAGALLHATVEAPAERWRHRRKLRQRTSGAVPPAVPKA